MNIEDLEQAMGITFTSYQKRILKVMLEGFDESIQTVYDWLQTDDAKDFFLKQEGLLCDYYRNSGINNKLDKMIHRRAKKGVDIIQELYKHVRKYGKDYGVTTETIQYSNAERIAMNELCDNTYELIKNVSEEEIRNIRRQLLEDYINGRHPLKSRLKELQLEPINNLSTEKRAELIALTETARAINTANLMTFIDQGVEYVELFGRTDKRGSEPCKHCKKQIKKGPVPISEALKHAIMHPRCRCTWRPARNPKTGVYQKID